MAGRENPAGFLRLCCDDGSERELLCWAEGRLRRAGQLERKAVILGSFLSMFSCSPKIPAFGAGIFCPIVFHFY